MRNSHIPEPSQDIRKTRFNVLKEEQYSLNMQIRLAMQRHDIQIQTDLEEQLREITEQIDNFL